MMLSEASASRQVIKIKQATNHFTVTQNNKETTTTKNKQTTSKEINKRNKQTTVQ